MASGSVLVVDDEESVAVTMGAILEMDGYTVAISTSGADALRRLDEDDFDLVLTDLRLDDVDGLTIISQAARVQPDTITIILTGYASLESAIKALREGAYDYLIKPCDVDELRAVVARGIERRQLGIQLKDRIADLEAANQTIRDMNRDLERRIDAATAELQQRMHELAQANEEIASLYRTGFANQPDSVRADDGLQLRDAYVAAAVRCAPPANKPTPRERDECMPYLVRELGVQALQGRVLLFDEPAGGINLGVDRPQKDVSSPKPAKFRYSPPDEKRCMAAQASRVQAMLRSVSCGSAQVASKLSM